MVDQHGWHNEHPNAMRLSHSQLTGWTGCGERHRLERVLKVPQVPAWNLIGGSAVHEQCEAISLRSLGVAETRNETFDETFARLTADKEDESSYDRSLFRASGRASKDWPNKENDAWWSHHGPVMVARWQAFLNACPWVIWIAPDGTPGVEITFELPLDPDENGEPRIVDRGAIDVVMTDPATGAVILVDIKTGASKQYSDQQLGGYKLGMEHRHGVTADYGAFWDARSGTTTAPASLVPYTLERLTYQFAAVRVAKQLNLYVPNPGPLCGSCSVRDSCYVATPSAPETVPPPWGYNDNPQVTKGND